VRPLPAISKGPARKVIKARKLWLLENNKYVRNMRKQQEKMKVTVIGFPLRPAGIINK
jgi:hypothetical protein